MIAHIGTVAIYVDDQQKALQFWTEKAGFEVYRNDPMGPDASWIEVGPKGTHSHLVIYPKTMMPNANELKASIVFVTENMAETYEMMNSNGVTFKQEPNEMPWGTFAIFADNEGNEFVLKG